MRPYPSYYMKMMNYEGNQLTVDPEHGQELENIFRISNPQSADSTILRYNFIYFRGLQRQILSLD